MFAGFMFGLGASAGGLIFVFGVFWLNWFFNGKSKEEAVAHHVQSLQALLARNAMTVETNEHLERIAKCLVYEMNKEG